MMVEFKNDFKSLINEFKEYKKHIQIQEILSASFQFTKGAEQFLLFLLKEKKAKCTVKNDILIVLLEKINIYFSLKNYKVIKITDKLDDINFEIKNMQRKSKRLYGENIDCLDSDSKLMESLADNFYILPFEDTSTSEKFFGLEEEADTIDCIKLSKKTQKLLKKILDENKEKDDLSDYTVIDTYQFQYKDKIYKTRYNYDEDVAVIKNQIPEKIIGTFDDNYYSKNYIYDYKFNIIGAYRNIKKFNLCNLKLDKGINSLLITNKLNNNKTYSIIQVYSDKNINLLNGKENHLINTYMYKELLIVIIGKYNSSSRLNMILDSKRKRFCFVSDSFLNVGIKKMYKNYINCDYLDKESKKNLLDFSL